MGKVSARENFLLPHLRLVAHDKAVRCEQFDHHQLEFELRKAQADADAWSSAKRQPSHGMA